MAVYEDEELAKLARELSEREGKAIPSPTYRQVYDFIKEISIELPVVEARSGLKHPPRQRMSPQSFVLSIPFPALDFQAAEHTMDPLVVTLDDTGITHPVHAALIICG